MCAGRPGRPDLVPVGPAADLAGAAWPAEAEIRPGQAGHGSPRGTGLAMMRIGYFLSSEEFGPRELVRQARLAEQAGLARCGSADHFHPWNGQQGNGPFVWSV